MAFIPEVAAIAGGSLIVRSTSWMTTSGRTFNVRCVVFTPSFVSPRIGVISEPA
jgi:hypothetical protein